jgi:S-adenosylmethionine hydrolase
VGAHLANGLPLTKLGGKINDPVLLEMTKHEFKGDGWSGEVVMVDVFGNLSTNISSDMLDKNLENLVVKIKDERIQGFTRTFGDAKPGDLIVTIDSNGTLAISVVNGDASQRLGADIGTRVDVILTK